MTGIDPRFHAAKKRAARRKLRANLWRFLPAAGGVAGLALAGLLVWSTWGMWQFGPRDATEEAHDHDTLDADAASDLTAQFVSAFVDLAGDPLIIRLSDDARAGQTTRKLDRPATMDPVRVISDLVLVSDAMVSAEEHFITTLPSSQEDFAFFQAQRSGAQGGAQPTLESMGLNPVQAPQPETDTADQGEIDDSEAGWGETLTNTTEALPGFAATAVENTTSVAFVRVEGARAPLFADVFVKIAAPRSLSDALISNGFSPETAAQVTEAATTIFGRSDLETGEVLAMRAMTAGGGKEFAQLSLYSGDVYVGSLARTSAGDIVEASDPWVQDDLFNYSDVEPETEAVPLQQYRMLDAFYSAGIRNRMPTHLVGEAILLLSKSHDLNAFANPGDRMSVLYAEHPPADGSGAGQILYIALKGQDVAIECFVFASAGGDYGCFGRTGGGQGGGAGLANGMAAPVRGVMTSTYGPRNHPILKTVRIHKGVDWAAPIGTPVTAAFDGKIAFAGNGGDYGNLVKITHANGFETRYAHMDRFADGVVAGMQVRAGDTVGYLGSTGLSTGPHLHFELRLNGEAIDPLGGGGAATAGGAVEALVNQIIRVESAGNAEAKNTLSTATGLGQFIESTWIRMMKTYRPDLATTLGRDESAGASHRSHHIATDGHQPGARKRGLPARARPRGDGGAAVSGAFPGGGRGGQGAVIAPRNRSGRTAGPAGHIGQPVPDRQGLRLCGGLGGTEDVGQGPRGGQRARTGRPVGIPRQRCGAVDGDLTATVAVIATVCSSLTAQGQARAAEPTYFGLLRRRNIGKDRRKKDTSE